MPNPKTAKKKITKKVKTPSFATSAPLIGRLAVPPEPKIEKNILDEITKEIRAQLGYPAAGPLPNGVAKIIGDAAKDSIKKISATNLHRTAHRIASDKLLGNVNLNAAIGGKIKVGLTGIQSVTANADYMKMLDENAKMMKAKFDAFKKAGFTDQQAFDLLEAEIYAKGAARKG